MLPRSTTGCCWTTPARSWLGCARTEPSSSVSHYHALVDAYLDEYERGKGLRDAQVIAFFDDYVHDSLSGFDTDETWPSDPRILYVGGDNKLWYAAAPTSENYGDLQGGLS